MDAFIQSFSALSEQLLPILGATSLVLVIMILVKLIKIFGNLNITVDKANKTIDLVDESLDKAQAPLNTVVKVSHTVDKAYDATISAVSTAKDYVVKQALELKDKVLDDSSKKEIDDGSSK